MVQRHLDDHSGCSALDHHLQDVDGSELQEWDFGSCAFKQMVSESCLWLIRHPS